MLPFLRGLLDLPHGLGFLLGRGRLLSIAAVPITINTALYAGLFVLLFLFLDDITGLLWDRPDGAWLLPLYCLYCTVVVLAATAIVFFTFTTVFTAIAGPFNSRISRRVREEWDKRPVAAPEGFYADFVYPLWLEVRLLILLIAVSVPCLLLQVIVPGSSLVLAPLQFLFTAFLLALGFLDYPLETDELPGFTGRVRYGLRHLGRTLGFGTALLLVMPVPVLGFFLIPAAVAGATLFYCDEKSRRSA